MGKTWLTHIVSFWVLVHGLLVASRLFNLLLNLNVGGVHLPLGPLAYVGLIIAAVVVIKRKRGARVVATAILAVPTFGILRMFIMRVVGMWPYDFSLLNQAFTLGYLLVNFACFMYMWRNPGGNPYMKSGEATASAAAR